MSCKNRAKPIHEGCRVSGVPNNVGEGVVTITLAREESIDLLPAAQKRLVERWFPENEIPGGHPVTVALIAACKDQIF